MPRRRLMPSATGWVLDHDGDSERGISDGGHPTAACIGGGPRCTPSHGPPRPLLRPGTVSTRRRWLADAYHPRPLPGDAPAGPGGGECPVHLPRPFPAMRLAAVFVATLAVSVVLSATATWGLTFSTSYSELQDMTRGFVRLASVAVEDFARLVRQLITETSDVVSGILEAEFQRSVAQMNATQYQFLQTTVDLMAQARNSTAQAQRLVLALLVSFGGFTQSVIADFQAVGTDYTARLRVQAASQAQANFNSMLQGRIFSLQRHAWLYKWGVLDLPSRPWDQPLDDATCTLVGVLCAASSEVQRNVYLGTGTGNILYCDVNAGAFASVVQRGSGSTTFFMPLWAAFVNSDPTANLSQWKTGCVGSLRPNIMEDTCPQGVGMEYPDYCNGTCGYDPRCRPWYTSHAVASVAQTQMTPIYIDPMGNVAMVTLSYPIFASSPRRLVAVAATDFLFSDVDDFLRAQGSPGASQAVAVILNLPGLPVVGTSRDCPPNAVQLASGVPITEVCDPALRLLGGWLAAHTDLQANASLELNGTLWDVFPAAVDAFSYFVAVGMNRSEVYAVSDAANAAARRTLSALSQQQAAQMAALEAAALAQMDALSAAKIASIQASQAALTKQQVALHAQMAQTFNASRQQSAADLGCLIQAETTAIGDLEEYRLSKVVNSIGTTFGAVVGTFVAILLAGGYGTWVVMKQVQTITETMEDVANMKVEQLLVPQKSSISEVQRIETALGILVQRLAEYKSYMPAGLFRTAAEEEEEDGPEEERPPSPTSLALRSPRALLSAPTHPRKTSACSSRSHPTSHRSVRYTTAPAPGMRQLLRRSVAALAVNLTRFQADLGCLSAAHLEATLNRYISAVHRVASKAQGNVGAILGDQVLVTFNAHFTSSDPPVTASSVALELLTTLREEAKPLGRVQIGVAAGPAVVGHLGCAQFKAMVALGAPMKVASLLSHLSDFEAHTVLVCPSVAERIQYHFTLQPVDLLTLPTLGEHINLYAKSIAIFAVDSHVSPSCASQEWLYEVNAKETSDPSGEWNAAFRRVAKAPTLGRAGEELREFLRTHPQHPLARWRPRVGLALAERPDACPDLETIPSSSPSSPTNVSLSLAVEPA